MSRYPRYQTVYQSLKKQIADGEYAPNDFLPVESKLEEIYGVSRTTIRKAVEKLASEGFLEVRQGRGTKVLEAHGGHLQNLNFVTSISETMTQRGHTVTTKGIYVDVVEASKRRSERLQVPVKTPLYRVQRVQLADGIPTAILENYIDTRLAPNLELKSSQIVSLYAFLEKEYGLEIDRSEDVISAKNADFKESQMLDVKPETALLILHRVTYSGNKPVTYDVSTVRADRYQLEIFGVGRQRSEN
ncbi:MAG: GntR family transcriptional regulator [Lachnospiraceae bacterium]|jgi:GntR family transcriptional regulator|nr:GntR family transcriptional regulator [Lachnospiraceae bacterium]